MAQQDILALLLTLDKITTGPSRLSQGDREDIQAGRELRAAVTEAEKEIQKEFPSMSRKGVERMAEVSFGVFMLLGEDGTDELASNVSTKIMEMLGEAKVPWAIEVGESMLADKYRPAYDKAKKAGVDPVVIFQADFSLTAEKATEIVDLVEKAIAEKDNKLKKS